MIKPLVYGQPTDAQRVATILGDELPRELAYLEGQVDSKPFLVGARLTIADIAVVTAFINAKYAGYEVAPERSPGLASYLQCLMALTAGRAADAAGSGVFRTGAAEQVVSAGIFRVPPGGRRWTA